MGTYVVTGGATGIGAAIKDGLRAAGHEVFVVDIKDRDIHADLSTPEGREAAIEEIRDRAPDGLDGLVTSAGVGAHLADVTEIVRINYFGTVDLVVGLEDLIAKKHGAIVLVSSESAFNPGFDEEFLKALSDHDEAAACARIEALDGIMRGYVAYGGGKAAIVHWMRHRTAALAAKQIRINAIAPGYTETSLTDDAKSSAFGEVMEEFAKSIPLGRPGQPEDMANGALFLLSEQASFVTGSTLHIDGGHDAIQRPDRVA